MKTTKHCAKCGTSKPVSEFYANSKSRGFSTYCKTNQIAYNNSTANKEKKREYNRDYHQRLCEQDKDLGKQQYAKMLDGLKSRPARLKANRFLAYTNARRMIVDSRVTAEFLEKLFNTVRHCECCGCEMCISLPEVKGQKRSNAASIDRIDNSKGYEPENIGVICLKCNARKRDMSLSDLENLVRYTKHAKGYSDVMR